MIKIEEKYDFNSIDKKIMEANSNIERNIDRFSADDRGFLSQNLLNALRTFVEYIAVKIYLTGKTEIINYDNGTVRIALDYIKSRGRIKFIERFHYYLQISRSHYIVPRGAGSPPFCQAGGLVPGRERPSGRGYAEGQLPFKGCHPRPRGYPGGRRHPRKPGSPFLGAQGFSRESLI